jgi:hypothetical protein
VPVLYSGFQKSSALFYHMSGALYVLSFCRRKLLKQRNLKGNYIPGGTDKRYADEYNNYEKITYKNKSIEQGRIFIKEAGNATRKGIMQ